MTAWLHTHTLTLWRGPERSESIPLHVDDAGCGYDERGRLRVTRADGRWHLAGRTTATSIRVTARIGRPPRAASPARERLAVRFLARPGRPACGVLLRVTADERALIERAAGDVPVSTWIREACGDSMAGGSAGIRDRCLEKARQIAELRDHGAV